MTDRSSASAGVLSPSSRYFIVAALRWLPVGLMAPLTVLFMRERGLSLSAIGIVMALYSATVLVLELPTGGLADAVGRRFALVAAGLIGVAAHAVMLSAWGVPAFAVAWVLIGCDRALDSGALESWYVDEERRVDPGRAIRGGLAGAGAAMALSIAVGSLVGGFLPRLATPAWTAVYSPLALPVFAAMLVHAVRVIVTLALIREDRALGLGELRRGFSQVPENVRGGLSLARRHRVVAALVVTVVAGGFALSSIENLWQPRFAALIGGVGERTALFGVMGAAAFLMGAVGSLASPALARIFRGRLARAGAVFEMTMGVVVVALALSPTLAPAAAAYGGFYVLVGLLDPMHRELLHSQVQSAQRSTMLSLDSLSLQAGGVFGSLLLSALAHARGIPTAWAAAGAALALGGLFYLRADRALEAVQPALQDV